MSRTQGDRKNALVVFRVVLLGFSVCLSLLVAEVFLRVLVPQPASWLPIYRKHPAFPFYAMQPNTRFHVDTGETNWTIATDEDGFRFDPDDRKKSTCTLLWLGDSYAFGHGLDYRDSFVGVVDQRLPDVRVRNAAVSGYGPEQYRRTLEYLIDQGLKFDFLIVASYVGNDFHDTKWDKQQMVEDGIVGNRDDLKSRLMRNMHLYRLLASSYHRFVPNPQQAYLKVVEQLARPDAWSEPFLSDARTRYQSEMARILELARSQHAQVAFAILPTRSAVSFLRHDAAEIPGVANQQPMLPVENAAQIFDRIGAQSIDLTPVVATSPASDMYFEYDGHLNQRGSAKVADAILERFPIECTHHALELPDGGPTAG